MFCISSMLIDRLRFLFPLCLIAAGCASQISGAPETGFNNLAALHARYRELGNPAADDYINGLAQRLNNGTPSPFTIEILRTSLTLAVSPAADTIAISSGLLINCTNEAQLSFILAHEIAHHQLGHVARLLDGEISASDSRDMELAADRRALLLMLRAGINPIGSLDALQRFHDKVMLADERYPTFPERLENVREMLKQLPQIGALDSREFRKLRERLA